MDHDAVPMFKHGSVKSTTDRSNPVHWPAVKLSRLPAGLNQKPFLQKHFERFGVIQKIICQPSLDCAFVAFDSVVRFFAINVPVTLIHLNYFCYLPYSTR